MLQRRRRHHSKTSFRTSNTQEMYVRGFVANNIFLTQAFYNHPKILVIALNGPAVGLSAALTGFGDFVYAVPHAFLLTPFTSLGLVSEGNASIGLFRGWACQKRMKP